jgi:hypothetical protein
VCFQETKLDVIDDFIVMQCVGPSFDGYVYVPAEDTRGGILLSWDTSILEVERISLDPHAITREVIPRDNNRWWLTTVYGPQSSEEKIEFMTELAMRRAFCPGPWMVMGDFNMILHAEDKNNDRLDRRMTARFRQFVHEHEMKDLYLHGRMYTWSNEREREPYAHTHRPCPGLSGLGLATPGRVPAGIVILGVGPCPLAPGAQRGL